MSEYRAGGTGGVAAVRPGAALMVAGPEAAAVAAELWASLAHDSSTAVLERLTADGLRRTPDFALLTWQSDGERLVGVRIIVRGGFEVVAGDTVVSGTAVSTWAERVVDGVERVEIVHADASGEDRWLPLVDGVVAAASVSVAGVASSGGATAAPLPARVAAEPAAAEPAAVPVAAPVAAPAAPAPVAAPPIASPEASAPVSEQTIAPAEETIVGVTDLIRPPAATGSLPAAAAAVPEEEVELDETIVRPIGDAAAFVPGDHDGMTVASADIRRLRAEREVSRPAPEPAAAPVEAASTVRVRMPDGSFEPIGHEIVLGRAPSVSKVSGGRLPRIVTIGQGDPDISRSHVRLALEGGTVVVTDLHSRNGTMVVAPGRAPVKLRAGEPTPVLIGTVVDLGGGWTIQVVGD
ncbi:FHA domain-containing protein [Agromyces sp. NPDC058136]|uniref:FHA domain-containing protein n=1 Tax=Agromyces sp. NPDC058136 TaxID=3346354 RepID=UPI0036D81B11